MHEVRQECFGVRVVRGGRGGRRRRRRQELRQFRERERGDEVSGRDGSGGRARAQGCGKGGGWIKEGR